MVTSGLMVLVLSDSDAATAYFCEDRQEGTPSSCTHQRCLSSVLGEKLFQGFGTSGAGELVFPSIILSNTAQQKLRSG